MGCSHSIVEDDEMKEKLKIRKEKFLKDKFNYEKLIKTDELLMFKVKQILTKEEINKLVYDEGRSIYDNDMSRDEGKDALYLLVTKELISKCIRRQVNLQYAIHRTLKLSESLIEEEDIEIITSMVKQMKLPSKADILVYSAKYFFEEFIEFVIGNLKYEPSLYLPSVFFYLIKSDLQNSQRMIDLGEIIDFNPDIKNLLVFLEPFIPSDYNHSKSKQLHYYKANCSNLIYFFDAIKISPTMENLCIISDQRVGMKLTTEAIDRFFEIFIEAESKCRIVSLTLINFDIKESELHRFINVFKFASSLKYFIFQPSWPNDTVLSNITEALKYSKFLDLFVFFHGRKCSDNELNKTMNIIHKYTNIKKTLFEDNFYYLKMINEKNKINNSLNFEMNIS